jgi:predicted DNA-binding transcriptional regulator AlpA
MDKPLVKIFGSNEPFISPSELAKLLNIRSETVSDWLSRYSDFPAVRLPGVIRMRVSEVEKWLAQFKAATRKAPAMQEVK